MAFFATTRGEEVWFVCVSSPVLNALICDICDCLGLSLGQQHWPRCFTGRYCDKKSWYNIDKCVTDFILSWGIWIHKKYGWIFKSLRRRDRKRDWFHETFEIQKIFKEKNGEISLTSFFYTILPFHVTSQLRHISILCSHLTLPFFFFTIIPYSFRINHQLIIFLKMGY